MFDYNPYRRMTNLYFYIRINIVLKKESNLECLIKTYDYVELCLKEENKKLNHISVLHFLFNQ